MNTFIALLARITVIVILAAGAWAMFRAIDYGLNAMMGTDFLKPSIPFSKCLGLAALYILLTEMQQGEKKP